MELIYDKSVAGRAGVSLIWLVPVIALIVTLGVAWNAYAGRGVMIEVEFTDATGIAWFDAADGIFQGMINQLDNPFEESDGTPIPLDENAAIKDIYDRWRPWRSP